MPVKVISFEDALKLTADGRRHLLLGNGFSIALFADRFRYATLLEEANFDAAPEAKKAFEALDTVDFELVIHSLRQSAALVPVYTGNSEVAAKMQEHAAVLKEALVQAIAGRHPSRPSEISDDQYAACRKFLAHFVGDGRNKKAQGGIDCRGNIYTFNYDLLLYWTLLHDQLIRWGADDPFNLEEVDAEPLEHDDGFRAPADDPEAAYVTWEAEGAADTQNIHFLHGALHLFDYGPDLQKKCWERAGGVPLIDQIRNALAEDKFPLFVAEGDSAGKLDKIRHSGYLQRSLKSFAQICRPRKNFDSSLFVYGHSFANNDEHVISFIERGKIVKLFIGLHGDPDKAHNREIVGRANRMIEARDEQFPLVVRYFDSASAKVWDED